LHALHVLKWIHLHNLQVVASSSDEVAANVQALFKTERMRIYTCKDVIGVEVGGALKNVFAIACGIAEGCGLGYNSAAALVTRGLSEMRKLALAMGAQEHTLSGLSGLWLLRTRRKCRAKLIFVIRRW
jgi:glycerol-3-phosphate dehydrogenase (NAD(P)+)